MSDVSSTTPSSLGPVAAQEPVAQVSDLQVSAGHTALLREVSFSIGRGERVGLIGESGSGKSLTALAMMGLLSPELSASGSVHLGTEPGARNVLTASERTMSRVRGNRVATIFQEPMTALNPTMRVGDQVAEAVRIHSARGRAQKQRRQSREQAAALLADVGLEERGGRVARAYPHQLSGGQRQRVVIAMALANHPDLIICDEPTTSVDVTVQARILDLLTRATRAPEAALLFITHDLALVSQVCDRMLVMYGGRIVEAGPVDTVLADPRHRYTQGLAAANALSGPRGALPTIPGVVPAAGNFPTGCVFRDRCVHASQACEVVPEWVELPGGRGHACVHPAGGTDS